MSTASRQQTEEIRAHIYDHLTRLVAESVARQHTLETLLKIVASPDLKLRYAYKISDQTFHGREIAGFEIVSSISLTHAASEFIDRFSENYGDMRHYEQFPMRGTLRAYVTINNTFNVPLPARMAIAAAEPNLYHWKY